MTKDLKKALKQGLNLALLVGVIGWVFTLYWMQGTGDVVLFLKSITVLRVEGVIQGYKKFVAQELSYPPFFSILLYTIGWASQYFSSIFVAYKFSLMFILFLSSGMLYWYSKSVLLLILFLYSMAISSVGLGYGDIFLAPFLMASMYEFRSRSYVLALSYFCIAALIKWQPLILGPILLIFLLTPPSNANLISLLLSKYLFKTIAGCLLIIGTTFYIFGKPAYEALIFMLSHGGGSLNPNSMNFPYMIGMVVNFSDGAELTRIVSNHFHPELWPWVRMPFLLASVFICFLFIRAEKTYESFLRFSILFFWTYYFLNTGVHENHLYLAALLSFLLDLSNRENLYLAILTSLAFNFNLACFYYFSSFPKFLEFMMSVGFVNPSIGLKTFTLIFNTFSFLFIFISLTKIYLRPANSIKGMLWFGVRVEA